MRKFIFEYDFTADKADFTFLPVIAIGISREDKTLFGAIVWAGGMVRGDIKIRKG